MPKIKFTKPYEVKDGTGTQYEVGDELECNDASANHFVSRGAAKYITGAESKTEGGTTPKKKTTEK